MDEMNDVQKLVVQTRDQLESIKAFADKGPLDVGDREFMRGHLKKLRLLVPKLAETIEQVGK